MGQPDCPVISRMPPRKSAPPPKRRLWPALLRLGVMGVVMTALWFIDTGALLTLAWQTAQAHPLASLGIAAILLGLLLIPPRLSRRKAKPAPRNRQRQSQPRVARERRSAEGDQRVF